MKTQAIFLDRDGTIIKDRGYISDPDHVELVPGADEAVRRFSEAGYLLVVASNQSGIARGMFDESTLSDVHARLEELLAEQGATLDGAYYCPYLDGPDATQRSYRRDSELRKPKPGMLLQAAREMNVDLRRSWMIGDSPRDVEAGRRAGCQTILLENGVRHDEDVRAQATHIASDLREAADILLGRPKKPATPILRNTTTATAAAATTPAPREPMPDSEPVAATLGQIRDLLDRAQRTKRQDDFSLFRLFGALLQMFAIVAALWGVIPLLNDDFAAATPRMMFACFLQLASISTFLVDRMR